MSAAQAEAKGEKDGRFHTLRGKHGAVVSGI
jgi:hypothetical protein